MQPIRREDILDLNTYGARRNEIRKEVMAEKNRRRLQVGDHIMLLFETWKTLWYQVQEMLRAESITEEEGIAHEMETYNELLPGPREISATMLIEYEDVDLRNKRLRELAGLKDHVWLELGGDRIKAQFDQRQMEDERISSVQFIRFDLGETTPEAWRKLGAQGRVRVVIDHPAMEVATPVPKAVAEALAEDLEASA